MSNIGMMDSAFFVGRKELVEWVNDTLELSITKIEDTAFGGIACQLLDIMYPGQVAMHKVDWSAKQSFEYVANYKILQNAFVKLNIEKYIDVDRLIKGRYQDNLEFMQWFKRFFEMNVTDKGDYDCAGQRAKGKGGEKYIYGSGGKGAVPKPAPRSVSLRSAPAPVSATKAAAAKPEPLLRVPVTKSSSALPSASASRSVAVPPPQNDAVAKELEVYKQKYEETARELEDSRLEMDDLTKERDFYFEKLREVEVALQELVDSGNGNETTDLIFKILYATAEGFEVQEQPEQQSTGGAPQEEAFEEEH